MNRAVAQEYSSRDNGQAHSVLQRAHLEIHDRLRFFSIARTTKFAVVFEHDDLEALTHVGGLPRLLESKIQDVENASNVHLGYDGDWIPVVNLPPHLAKYFPDVEDPNTDKE